MTLGFSESALLSIEFPAALDLVAQHAVSPLGAARVRALRPATDPWLVDHELARVGQYLARRDAGDDVRPEAFPDIAAAIARLRLEGSVLEGRELAEVGVALAAARAVHGRMVRAGRVAPLVAALGVEPPARKVEDALASALEPDGLVKDAASRDLAQARRDVREVREELVKRLAGILASLDGRLVPPDAAATVRGGRYVIPVRREARSRLGGIVHDESATHATLFVEPSEAIELGNRLREAEASEAREVLRVLRRLTELLRPEVEALAAAFEMLIAVDCCAARASFAAAAAAAVPTIVERGAGTLAIVKGLHPLLLGGEGERKVVPFDLVLDPDERTILVSGPNAGGKTVLLKAVGLIVALAQSGIIPPVGAGTRLPVFAALFADIGDRQSIQESLSTFSAHVASLREVLEGADAASLALLDELGTGTDPAEGAALAAAVLRSLTARGCTTLATTHLGSLKELASKEPGIVNASLQFDAVQITPTFRFTKGIPGRSYGLAIARRLGLDAAVLAEAERALPDGVRTLETTLAGLEARIQEVGQREAELAARAAALEGDAARTGRRESDLAGREQEIRRKEKELERSGKRAMREYLLEARAEVEKAIALARQEQKEREARRQLEDAIAAVGAAEVGPADVTEPAPGGPRPAAAGPVAPGDRVLIAPLGIEGDLESVQGGEATVLVRGRRVRVASSALAPVPT
jgi:DNA mismatch repair protein MutS2